MKDIDKALQIASTTSNEEELKFLVHHPSSKVISKLILNSNLTENLALIIASRKNIPNPDIEIPDSATYEI